MTMLPASAIATDDNIPMPLDVAAKTFFPHGGATKNTMLAACRSGALGYEQVGNRYLVTWTDVETWRKQCRVRKSQQGHISEGEREGPPDSSSSTMDENMKLDLANAAIDRLKKLSRNISPQGIGQTQPNVIRLKSRRQK